MGGGIVEVCVSGDSGERAVEETVGLFDAVISLRRRRTILRALAGKAAAGDLQVAAFLFDRIYGRPGVAQAGAVGSPKAAEAETVRLDVRRLNEKEMVTFARLFEKCVVKDDSAGCAARGTVGRRRVSVSP